VGAGESADVEFLCDESDARDAVKQMTEKNISGVPITVEGKLVNKDGAEHMEVSVKDSGVGIDKTNLGRIFDKYEQVTVNAPVGMRGLGLGLSICKTIVDRHGGIIWADSELNKGSIFIFQVPVFRKTEG